MTDSTTLSTDTDGTTDDRQHVVKPAVFVTHIPNRNFDSPQPQNGNRGPKNLISILLCFIVLFNDRFRRWQKTQCKNEGPKNSKNMHFCGVHFSFSEKQILETRCIKQHAFLVRPLRDLHGFSNAHTLMFLDPKERGSNKERRSKLRSRDGPASKFRSPGPPKGAHSD